MLKAHIQNGQLFVEGSPMGLSSTQIAQRADKNLFKIDTVYSYKIRLPKYLTGKTAGVSEQCMMLLYRVYEWKISANGEVGRYFENSGKDSITFVFFVENSVYSWNTAKAFKKVIDIAIGRVKRPYYAEWKETRRSANQASYVKPSQIDSDSNQHKSP